eukprot:Rmarinus@m.11443
MLLSTQDTGTDEGNDPYAWTKPKSTIRVKQVYQKPGRSPPTKTGFVLSGVPLTSTKPPSTAVSRTRSASSSSRVRLTVISACKNTDDDRTQVHQDLEPSLVSPEISVESRISLDADGVPLSSLRRTPRTRPRPVSALPLRPHPSPSHPPELPVAHPDELSHTRPASAPPHTQPHTQPPSQISDPPESDLRPMLATPDFVGEDRRTDASIDDIGGGIDFDLTDSAILDADDDNGSDDDDFTVLQASIADAGDAKPSAQSLPISAPVDAQKSASSVLANESLELLSPPMAEKAAITCSPSAHVDESSSLSLRLDLPQLQHGQHVGDVARNASSRTDDSLTLRVEDESFKTGSQFSMKEENSPPIPRPVLVKPSTAEEQIKFGSIPGSDSPTRSLSGIVPTDVQLPVPVSLSRVDTPMSLDLDASSDFGDSKHKESHASSPAKVLKRRRPKKKAQYSSDIPITSFSVKVGYFSDSQEPRTQASKVDVRRRVTVNKRHLPTVHRRWSDTPWMSCEREEESRSPAMPEQYCPPHLHPRFYPVSRTQDVPTAFEPESALVGVLPVHMHVSGSPVQRRPRNLSMREARSPSPPPSAARSPPQKKRSDIINKMVVTLVQPAPSLGSQASATSDGLPATSPSGQRPMSPLHEAAGRMSPPFTRGPMSPLHCTTFDDRAQTNRPVVIVGDILDEIIGRVADQCAAAPLPAVSTCDVYSDEDDAVPIVNAPRNPVSVKEFVDHLVESIIGVVLEEVGGPSMSVLAHDQGYDAELTVSLASEIREVVDHPNLPSALLEAADVRDVPSSPLSAALEGPGDRESGRQSVAMPDAVTQVPLVIPSYSLTENAEAPVLTNLDGSDAVEAFEPARQSNSAHATEWGGHPEESVLEDEGECTAEGSSIIGISVSVESIKDKELRQAREAVVSSPGVVRRRGSHRAPKKKTNVRSVSPQVFRSPSFRQMRDPAIRDIDANTDANADPTVTATVGESRSQHVDVHPTPNAGVSFERQRAYKSAADRERATWLKVMKSPKAGSYVDWLVSLRKREKEPMETTEAKVASLHDTRLKLQRSQRHNVLVGQFQHPHPDPHDTQMRLKLSRPRSVSPTHRNRNRTGRHRPLPRPHSALDLRSSPAARLPVTFGTVSAAPDLSEEDVGGVHEPATSGPQPTNEAEVENARDPLLPPQQEGSRGVLSPDASPNVPAAAAMHSASPAAQSPELVDSQEFTASAIASETKTESTSPGPGRATSAPPQGCSPPQADSGVIMQKHALVPPSEGLVGDVDHVDVVSVGYSTETRELDRWFNSEDIYGMAPWTTRSSCTLPSRPASAMSRMPPRQSYFSSPPSGNAAATEILQLARSKPLHPSARPLSMKPIAPPRKRRPQSSPNLESSLATHMELHYATHGGKRTLSSLVSVACAAEGRSSSTVVRIRACEMLLARMDDQYNRKSLRIGGGLLSLCQCLLRERVLQSRRPRSGSKVHSMPLSEMMLYEDVPSAGLPADLRLHEARDKTLSGLSVSAAAGTRTRLASAKPNVSLVRYLFTTIVAACGPNDEASREVVVSSGVLDQVSRILVAAHVDQCAAIVSPLGTFLSGSVVAQNGFRVCGGPLALLQLMSESEDALTLRMGCVSALQSCFDSTPHNASFVVEGGGCEILLDCAVASDPNPVMSSASVKDTADLLLGQQIGEACINVLWRLSSTPLPIAPPEVTPVMSPSLSATSLAPSLPLSLLPADPGSVDNEAETVADGDGSVADREVVHTLPSPKSERLPSDGDAIAGELRPESSVETIGVPGLKGTNEAHSDDGLSVRSGLGAESSIATHGLSRDPPTETLNVLHSPHVLSSILGAMARGCTGVTKAVCSIAKADYSFSEDFLAAGGLGVLSRCLLTPPGSNSAWRYAADTITALALGGEGQFVCTTVGMEPGVLPTIVSVVRSSGGSCGNEAEREAATASALSVLDTLLRGSSENVLRADGVVPACLKHLCPAKKSKTSTALSHAAARVVQVYCTALEEQRDLKLQEEQEAAMDERVCPRDASLVPVGSSRPPPAPSDRRAGSRASSAHASSRTGCGSPGVIRSGLAFRPTSAGNANAAAGVGVLGGCSLGVGPSDSLESVGSERPPPSLDFGVEEEVAKAATVRLHEQFVQLVSPIGVVPLARPPIPPPASSKSKGFVGSDSEKEKSGDEGRAPDEAKAKRSMSWSRFQMVGDICRSMLALLETFRSTSVLLRTMTTGVEYHEFISWSEGEGRISHAAGPGNSGEYFEYITDASRLTGYLAAADPDSVVCVDLGALSGRMLPATTRKRLRRPTENVLAIAKNSMHAHRLELEPDLLAFSESLDSIISGSEENTPQWGKVKTHRVWNTKPSSHADDEPTRRAQKSAPSSPTLTIDLPGPGELVGTMMPSQLSPEREPPYDPKTWMHCSPRKDADEIQRRRSWR